MGHAVKPIGEQRARLKGRSLASQNEKRRLKCVFGIVMMSQNPATNAPDQSAVPVYERCKSRFVAFFDKMIQQLSIAEPRSVSKRSPAKVLNNLGKLVSRHILHPLG